MPGRPDTTYLAGIITQKTSSGVVQSRNFKELICTGGSQSFALKVPAPAARTFGTGTALVQSEVSQDNEPGSWQGTEVSVVRLDPGRVREPRTVVRESLDNAPPNGSDPYLDASVEVDKARILARGAGITVAYEADCPQDYFSYLFTNVTQGDQAADAVLEFYCAGDSQQLVTVVAAPEGPGFKSGPAQVSAFLNNCPEDVGCFRADDNETVWLQKQSAWWS